MNTAIRIDCQIKRSKQRFRSRSNAPATSLQLITQRSYKELCRNVSHTRNFTLVAELVSTYIDAFLHLFECSDNRRTNTRHKPKYSRLPDQYVEYLLLYIRKLEYYQLYGPHHEVNQTSGAYNNELIHNLLTHNTRFERRLTGHFIEKMRHGRGHVSHIAYDSWKPAFVTQELCAVEELECLRWVLEGLAHVGQGVDVGDDLVCLVEGVDGENYRAEDVEGYHDYGPQRSRRC
jgi:hypothetical protein